MRTVAFGGTLPPHLVEFALQASRSRHGCLELADCTLAAQPARLVIKISFGFIHHCGKSRTATSPLTAGDVASAVSEAAQAFAFVAIRQATRTLPAARWAHILSLELGWMTPAQARRYVAAAQDAGLLATDGDELRLTLDPATVTIGRRFRPDPDATPAPPPTAPVPEGGFAGWLQRLAAAKGDDPSLAMEAVTLVQDRFGGHLGAYPALLVASRDAGLDVQEDAQAELNLIIQSAP